MFLFTDLFWDKIKNNRKIKKAIYLDEVWRLIGITSNKDVASFIYKIFKTIRKYGGSSVAITQDISDLFSLDDYHSDKMDYAKTLLVTELEYQDEFKINELLPIAVSRDDMDLFVLVVGGNSIGQVIWFAGGVIERFDSIKSFLSGMMGYSKADMKDLLS